MFSKIIMQARSHSETVILRPNPVKINKKNNFKILDNSTSGQRENMNK